MAARKVRRATGSDFVISLASNDFSRNSNTYVGKLRYALHASQSKLKANMHQGQHVGFYLFVYLHVYV